VAGKEVFGTPVKFIELEPDTLSPVVVVPPLKLLEVPHLYAPLASILPCGLTLPFEVNEVDVIEVASPVVTVGIAFTAAVTPVDGPEFPPP
jgi:hypothetical protein